MSEIFTGFINNYIIQVAALSWLTAQVLKTIINFVFTKKFKAERLIGAGGMPSSHTALVVSTAVATAKECGTSSPIFALAALFAAVVMYDAMGVRYAAGEQAKVINQLVDEWLDTMKFDQEKIPHFKELKEMLGHTPIEVIGGIIVGIVVSSIV